MSKLFKRIQRNAHRESERKRERNEQRAEKRRVDWGRQANKRAGLDSLSLNFSIALFQQRAGKLTEFSSILHLPLPLPLPSDWPLPSVAAMNPLPAALWLWLTVCLNKAASGLKCPTSRRRARERGQWNNALLLAQLRLLLLATLISDAVSMQLATPINNLGVEFVCICLAARN